MAATVATPPPRYQTHASDVKVGTGQALRFAKGKGYYAGAPAKTPNTFGVSPGELSQYGLTPAQLRQMVAAEVAAQVTPQKQALASARGQTDHDYNQELAAVRNLTGDYSSMLKGIAPAVESTYDNAGNAVADYAKGFSGAVQGQLDAAKPGEQSLLAAAGAPQAQVDSTLGHLAAPTDSLYGMAGAIPAGALAREGAAMTSAAQALPGEAVGRGQQNALLLTGQKSNADRDYATKLSQLLASVPGLQSNAVGDVMKNARSDLAEQLLLQKYGLQQRTEVGNLTGVDPATGKPTYKATQAATKAQVVVGTKHAAAVERRNRATSGLLTKLSNYVYQQRHKQGAVVVGHEPRDRTLKDAAGLSVTQYLTPQGWVTSATGQPPKGTLMKPIYDYHHQIPSDYNSMKSYITRTLTVGLKGYGYKPSDIQEMVTELIGSPPPAGPPTYTHSYSPDNRGYVAGVGKATTG